MPSTQSMVVKRPSVMVYAMTSVQYGMSTKTVVMRPGL